MNEQLLFQSNPWNYIRIADFKRDQNESERKGIRILFVLKGKIKLRIAGKSYNLTDSDFFILHQSDYELQELQSALAVNIEIIPEATYFPPVELKGNSVNSRSAGDEDLQRKLADLVQLYSQKKTVAKLKVYKTYFEILNLLVDHFAEKSTGMSGARKQDLKSERFQRIVEYLNYNYKMPISLNDIAGEFYISVPYLSKLFKNESGINLTAYLNDIRLRHTVEEILVTDKQITKIAMENGFPNLSSFNKLFKKRFGVTPTVYREEQQRTQSAPEAENEPVDIVPELYAYFKEHKNEAEKGDFSKRQLIDCSKEFSYEKNWNRLINIGYAYDIMTTEVKNHLKIMQEHLDYEYARFWGIFSDEMLMESDRDQAAEGHNFSRIDQLIEILKKNGLKPFIEVGEKPKMIFRATAEMIHEQRYSHKTRSAADWRSLIGAFIKHSINKWGKEEVATWRFELWRSNETIFDADVGKFKYYLSLLKENQLDVQHLFKEYFSLFEIIYSEIKAYVPEAQVGGCGLSMDTEGYILPNLLAAWMRERVRPDFFSMLIYPLDFSSAGEQIEVENEQSADPAYMKKQLKEIAAFFKENHPGLTYYVTEWNISISNRNYLNDSSFKAAYIVKNMIDTIGYAGQTSYWLFSDIFSEYRDASDLLYGGAGLITRDAVLKPSFYAFAFLGRLGNKLVEKGQEYVVTKKTDERLQLLCCNYKHFNSAYYFHTEGSIGPRDLYEIFEDSIDKEMSFQLGPLPKGRYRVKRYIINRENGCVLDEWLKLGAEKDIKADEIDYLRSICTPAIRIEYVDVTNGRMQLKETLQAHEIRFISVEKVY
ncbi:GH39 family glycosyl hydrolase [Listeria costaricensis]|uniref:GH39 family glycosyl hydrolase n=1 Tax=Listeria costaricensis TaxID=2026604 RepID=UPI000C072B83|nr:helix-turn-helix domain-containing protein [Listeria costaricensis]